MKSDLIARALKIAAARDDLLAARERRSKARLAWAKACGNASFGDEYGNLRKKFELLAGYPDDYFAFTSYFQKLSPEFIQGDSAESHPDYIAWFAAGKEKYEANKAHGIALRRLLQIGVKK